MCEVKQFDVVLRNLEPIIIGPRGKFQNHFLIQYVKKSVMSIFKHLIHVCVCMSVYICVRRTHEREKYREKREREREGEREKYRDKRERERERERL